MSSSAEIKKTAVCLINNRKEENIFIRSDALGVNNILSSRNGKDNNRFEEEIDVLWANNTENTEEDSILSLANMKRMEKLQLH